jgi:hypothetical protein
MEISESETFISTFLYDRITIPIVVKDKVSYDFLANIFKTEENTKRNNCVRRLLLGLDGYEHNKQMSLYSIPTSEFMNCVKIIQNFLNVNHVVELYAGLGLFSNLYSNFMSDDKPTIVEAYDANRQFETSTDAKFYTINKMSFEKFIIDRISLQNKICVAIFPNYILDFLDEFLRVCKPKCLIIVMENESVSKFQHLRNNYHLLELNLKIITYIDYFLDDKTYLNSKTLVISNDNIPNELFPNSLMYENNNSPQEMLLSKYVVNNMFPKWIMDLSEQEQKELLRISYSFMNGLEHTVLLKNILQFINKNIRTYDEYIEYFSWKPRPPIFCSFMKYAEYRTLYHLVTESNLESLIQQGIFPKWIVDKKSAFIFLYLEYEITEKNWKTNRTVFNRYKRVLGRYFD